MSRTCDEQEMKVLDERIEFYRKRESEIYSERQRKKNENVDKQKSRND